MIIPILPLLNVEQCVVICSNNVIHITLVAWKEIFASSFIPSEFKPLFHCIPVFQIITEIGRVFIMLLYPPLNKSKVGILVSPCPSVSTLFSMLFSALWLGCGELGMRKYSPRYLRVMAEMRRFLRIPVRILPSAFPPHFFPYRNAEKYAEISPRSCLNTPIRIFSAFFSAFFAIQECGDFSAFLSKYSHPHFLRKENAEIWGTG